MAAHSRRISSATLGKKAHFCDRHHIAGAPSALVSHASGTACAVLNSEITGLDERRFLARLEAENAQLRRSVVELVLQLQALRDGAGTIRAYDAARHRPDVP